VTQATYHDTRFRNTPERRRLWPVLAAYIQRRFIPEDSTVLDLGAGYCYFANSIRARERHAVDVADVVRDHAGPGVVPHVTSSDSLGELGDGFFDVVFASNLFEHLDRGTLDGTLDEVRRVLRKGGRLIVLQPNFRYCVRSYFDDYTHVQVFTDRSISDVLAGHGLVPETVIPRFLPFSVESRLPVSPLLLAIYLRLPYRPAAGQMLVVARRI
jgi:SAM-dependent methyltransferase